MPSANGIRVRFDPYFSNHLQLHRRAGRIHSIRRRLSALVHHASVGRVRPESRGLSSDASNAPVPVTEDPRDESNQTDLAGAPPGRGRLSALLRRVRPSANANDCPYPRGQVILSGVERPDSLRV